MPFDPRELPQSLIDAARRRDLIPLVGAGFSKQASPDFPNWRELLERMTTEAQRARFIDAARAADIRDLMATGRFLMAAEQLKRAFPLDAYLSLLETTFGRRGVRTGRAHRALFALKPPLIMTTNYDYVLEDAYARELGLSANIWTHEHVGEVQRSFQSGGLTGAGLTIFKLHGSVGNPREIILSDHDYRRLRYGEPGYRLILSAIFLTKTVLMVGFSAEDPELLNLLETNREYLKHGSGPDYAFLPQPANSVYVQRLREDFGIQIVPYEPSDGHPEVADFLELLAAEVGQPAAATA